MRLPVRHLAIPLLLLLSAQGATAQSVEEKAQLCESCHGDDGVPQDKSMPIIWGQQEGYLYLQLRDYKSGARKDEIMSQVAADLEKQDMLDLAAYFAGKTWPTTEQPKPSAEAVKQATTANNSVVCTGCHLDKYQGTGTAPRIAGQNVDYLERTMLAFRDKSRGNNPGMTGLMESISEGDIKALASYLAAL